MKKLIAAATLCLSTSAFAIPTGPVMIGGDVTHDACGGWGIATATTTLFTTNEMGYSEFKVINVNQGVSLCDEKQDYDGEYYGVIFSKDENVNCFVSSPEAERQPYTGPCESGWVKKEHLLLIAG